jgi:hypothetical protein
MTASRIPSFKRRMVSFPIRSRFTSHRVFKAHADGGETASRRFLRGREFSSRRCFLRSENRAPLLEEALEALLLRWAAARGKG